MPTLDERIAKEQQKLDQLKRQKRAREQREKKIARAIDTRRKIIAGAIVLDIFPQFQSLQPKRNNEENYIEFEPLAKLLKDLRDGKKT
jgi:hypothetical protein